MVKVSFIIPTLNAGSVLKNCLNSIKQQNFDSKKIEILIIDGGSTDNTISIAKKFKCLILQNPLKTAEAGKAIGVKRSLGEYIALIDSDNILPDKNWLNTAILPLEKDLSIIGSEPWQFTYRPKSGIFERYSALIGANDPYAFVTGVYDRKNYINDKWTGLKIDSKDYNTYLKIILSSNNIIPTIGANGTIFRSSFLKKNSNSDYLFDIDIISQYLKTTNKTINFAKVKIGIIHTYCESSLKKFIKKQKRRLTDYYQYKNYRDYNWDTSNFKKQLNFILYSVFLLPSLIDSVRGCFKKPDIAWFIHPIACLITLYLYVSISIKYRLGFLKPVNRTTWQQ
jgi:glycosyltransferase involved in cell wall biosynthesis